MIVSDRTNPFFTDTTYWKPDRVEDYVELQAWIADIRKTRGDDDWVEVMRWYGRNDLFYLLNFILLDGNQFHSQFDKELFHYHEYFLDSCRTAEYHAQKGTGLDCSARGSGKSRVRTKALPIAMILNEPNISIMIFSVTKLLAEKHMRLIKDELTHNELLKTLYPEILWANPRDETFKAGLPWSVDTGIVVKRTIPRSNCTVEMHALFGGGPVGSRPDVVIADDIENSSMVITGDKIDALKSAFSEAVSLVTPVVIPIPTVLMSNTRFSGAGLIQEQYDRLKAEDPRLTRMVPAEDTFQEGPGPLNGTALYPFTNELLWRRWSDTVVKQEYGLQFALRYDAIPSESLDANLIEYYKEDPINIARDCVIYMCIDASMGVIDPTCIWIWGIDKNNRKYWLDAVVRKLDPSKPEFMNEIIRLHSKWSAYGQRFVQIRVDAFGNQPWPELITSELQKRKIYANVVGCTAVGATSIARSKTQFGSGKIDRIYQRWSPMLNRREVKMPLPQRLGGAGIMSKNSNGDMIDLVDHFLSTEFTSFPRMKHEDMFDASSLLYDEKANQDYPLEKARDYVMMNKLKNRYSQYSSGNARSWMSA